MLLILILLFVIFGPDQQPINGRFQRDPEALEERSRQLLGVLRNSSYGDLDAKANRWLNLTGFREYDGYQWDLLPAAQEVARSQLRTAADGVTGDLPVYHRPEGELRGRFSRLQDGIRGHHLNLTALVPGNDYVTANSRGMSRKQTASWSSISWRVLKPVTMCGKSQSMDLFLQNRRLEVAGN